MYLIGYDVGSSSVKAALLEADSGKCLATSFYPKEEMTIHAKQTGWAEQDPDMWWDNLQKANAALFKNLSINKNEIKAIGISYQMHGLVLVDKDHKALRPSIIWCDSRAATIGESAFQEIGKEKCLSHLLNSPGNFTASKLRWVKENEPQIFDQVYKFMLPGDYIAMRMTGEVVTTVSGLSEGIFWDFNENQLADFLLDHYQIPPEMVANTQSTFSEQGRLTQATADLLGIPVGTPVTYRAGDQPNNAFSLNVLQPGEVAATAGTSGVVYSVSDKVNYDPRSRVNTFAHVNHKDKTRLGILLCINGCGILNAWLRKQVANVDYEKMNALADQVAIGADGLSILPFGNGVERVLENKPVGAQIHGLNFNIHEQKHLFRAGQEGIAFAFYYGMEIMQNMGVNLSSIRAAKANLFLSPIFRKTLAAISGATIQLYNTDGAVGAARGAGIGLGYYKSDKEAFENLEVLEMTTPDEYDLSAVQSAYLNWKSTLKNSKR